MVQVKKQDKKYWTQALSLHSYCIYSNGRHGYQVRRGAASIRGWLLFEGGVYYVYTGKLPEWWGWSGQSLCWNAVRHSQEPSA